MPYVSGSIELLSGLKITEKLGVWTLQLNFIFITEEVVTPPDMTNSSRKTVQVSYKYIDYD